MRLLDAPIQMSSMSLANVETDSIWMQNPIKDDSLRGVDKKKLLKAELKLQQKQEKRETTSNMPKTYQQDCQASTAQMISKKDNKMLEASAGNSKIVDIKIENFDVAFGDKYGIITRKILYIMKSKSTNF